VLSLEEAGRMEHYGIWPTCKHHRHISKRDAETLIKAETHRQVGGMNTAVECSTYIVSVNVGSVWQPVPCSDWNGKPVNGLRIWGLPRTV